MSSERWRDVERLFYAALAQPTEKRAVYLAEVCPNDPELKKEVELLLAAEGLGTLSRGPLVSAPDARLPSEPGVGSLMGGRLGVYEILGMIGKGGMGDVYRAHDPRLHRDVAIKVVSAHAVDTERLARFEKEARAAAALNHPNIMAVHDVGRDDGVAYIVSELLDGTTLRGRLSAGLLPPRKAVEYAIGIAQGLAAAHSAGVVHRDLKPENIVITADERVKIIDFGLAKLTQRVPQLATVAAGVDSTNDAITQPGVIFGTIGYMSPEQLRGRPADQSSDMFSFGVVLYEMLAGQRPFVRESALETMTATLEDDPPPLPLAERRIPAGLARVVTRCLEKNPASRFKSADDLSFALDALSLNSDTTVTAGLTAQVARASALRRLSQAVAWTIVGVVGTLAAVPVLRPAPRPAALRFQVGPPEGGIFPGGNNTPRMSISPDGQYLAFALDLLDGTPTRLWLRRLDNLEARALPNTDAPPQAEEPVQAPFWSRDSRHVAFFEDGRLRRVDLSTGDVQTLATNLPGNNFGGSWNAQDVILFGNSLTKGLRRMSGEGGASSQVTMVNDADGEEAHLWPEFLPDGRHFLYFAFTPSPAARAVYAGSLDSPQRKLVLKSVYMAHFAPPDHLLFLRDGALLVQRFDVNTLELRGESVQIADAVQGYELNGRVALSVSDTGVLAFRPGDGIAADTDLMWFNRSGVRIGSLGSALPYRGVELSPDGGRVAVHREEREGTGDIWLLDLQRGTTSRFTFASAQHNTSPVWSPDGRRLYYSRSAGGSWAMYERDSAGAGGERLLYQAASSLTPLSVTPDQRFLLFRGENETTYGDLLVLSLDEHHTVKPYTEGPHGEDQGQVSPDGNWVAYTSNESGRNEIFVQSFPSAGTRYQVSTSGGMQPRWRGDGKELFYMGSAGQVGRIVGRLMAVSVERTATELRLGNPTALFDSYVSVAEHQGASFNYAVTSDGQRFLVARQRVLSNSNPAATPLTVVVNWTSALPQR